MPTWAKGVPPRISNVSLRGRFEEVLLVMVDPGAPPPIPTPPAAAAEATAAATGMLVTVCAAPDPEAEAEVGVGLLIDSSPASASAVWPCGVVGKSAAAIGIMTQPALISTVGTLAPLSE